MRKQFLALAVLFWVSAPLFAASTSDFPIIVDFDRYDSGSIENNSNDMHGRLYMPAGTDPKALVIFYHGLGETGSNAGYNNTAQINGNINNLRDAAVANGFAVYAPQTWAGWGSDQLDTTMAVAGRIVRDYNIDTSRIYVTGLSLGGGAAWDVMSAYDEVFAAGVPIAGVNNGGIIPANIADIPIWAYHADNDGTVSVNTSRNTLNNIRAAQGHGPWTYGDGANSGAPYYNDGSRYYEQDTLRYSEYEGGGHGIWGRAYNEDATLYPWMLGKTSGLQTLQVGDTVRFNTGWSTIGKETQVNGVYWNSFTYGLGQTTDVVRAFARTDDTNTNTTLSLENVVKFSNDTGANNTATAVGTSWTVWSGSAVMRINGLAAGGEYDLEFFSSSSQYSGATRFTADGQSVDLTYTSNVNTTAMLESVFADANGQLLISVGGAPSGGFGILNWFSITAVDLHVPEPASLSLLALGGFGLLRPRRTRG